MSVTTFSLNATLAQAVEDGLCHVSVVFTSTGTDAWVRPLPGAQSGMKPHTSMTIEEATEAYKRVIKVESIGGTSSDPAKGKEKEPTIDIDTLAEAMSKTKISTFKGVRPQAKTKVKLGAVHDKSPLFKEFLERLDSVRGRIEDDPVLLEQVLAMEDVGTSSARNRVTGRGLDKFTSNTGATGSMPLESLNLRDFVPERTVMDLFMRMVVVADNIGAQKLVERARSAPFLVIGGVRNLREWWAHASGQQRISMISTAKTLKPQTVPGWALTLVKALPCPFRGTASTLGVSVQAPFGTDEHDETLKQPGSGWESEGFTA